MQVGDGLVQIIKLQSVWEDMETYTQVIGFSSLVDILDRLLQIDHLFRDFLLRLLGILDGLGLKRLNALQDGRNIVRDRLELACSLLNLINDLGVLEHGAVVVEIDGGAGCLEMVEFCVGVDVAFAEGGQGGCGLWVQRQGRGEADPVDLGDCRA